MVSDSGYIANHYAMTGVPQRRMIKEFKGEVVYNQEV